MWQVNFCPNCGARAASNVIFCGSCGFNLTTVIPQVPPMLYEYQLPYHQWVACGASYHEAGAYVNNEDRNVSPMGAQISRLLEELFEKRVRYGKT